MQKNAPDFGTETISRILLRIAPPVMLALLIQALYNVVDSCFVGKFSDDALTALPVFWLLSLIGLNYTWLAFPVAETAAGALGYIMYRRQLKVWK